MSKKNELYTQRRFIFMALDPIHIGTGGYSLGRVDNTIMREPGTNLPKLPGTSLMGAARNYAAMRYGKPEAAGQQNGYIGDKSKDPIIYTFGTATKTGGGRRGKVSIGDAQILFFPVHSVAGPVWVSTKEILDEAGFQTENAEQLEEETALTSLPNTKDYLNLGWLRLETENGLTITLPDAILKNKEWEAIENRIVLVSQKLFSHIVNSNLEVRTSVAIDPETGAAEDKALFTYEAIPRATWFWCDIIQDDYCNEFPETKHQFKRENGVGQENAGKSLGEEWTGPMDVVNAGLRLIEYLGIGGMGTRGFGRLKNIHSWEVAEHELRS